MSAIIDYEYTFASEGGDEAADRIQVTISSELTQGYATGRVVDASRGGGVVAVRDARGDLAVLSIGERGHLFLVRQQRGSATGWEQHDLSDRPVERFDAAQTPAGDIAVYAILGGKLCQAAITATALASEARLALTWTETAWQPRGRVTFLSAGTPLVIVMVEENGRIERHVVNGKRPTHFPSDVAEVLDAVAGQLVDRGVEHPGIFTLYRTTANETTIAFVGQGDTEYEFVLDPEDVPDGARALAVAASDASAAETDLYVGGSGVWKYDPASLKDERSVAANVAPAAQVRDVSRLHVRKDGQGTTVWAFAGAKDDGTLHHIARIGNRWSHAAPTHAGAIGVAPIRSSEESADELVVVGRGGALTRARLDPRTKLWTETDIPLQDDGKLQAFDAYTTVLHVERRGVPVAAQSFELDASEWLEATVNGIATVLGKGPVRVTSDALGRITIVSKAAALATAVFTLRGPAGGPVTFDPARKVRAGLRTADVPALRKQFPDTPSDQLEAVAVAMQRLSSVSGFLPEDGSVQAAETTRALMSAEEAAPWGLTFDGGAVRLLGAAECSAVLAGEHFDFFDFAGDALRFISNTVGKVIHVAVDAVKVVIRIGKETIQFMIETVTQVLATMHTVLEKIGATMAKLVDWLGFVFDWGDILTTHKVLVNVAQQSWTFARGQVDAIDAQRKRFFDMLEQQVQALQIPQAMRNAEMFGSARAASARYDRDGNGAALLTRSPAANFATQHLAGAAEALEGALQAELGGIESNLLERLEKLFTTEEQKALVVKIEAMMTTLGQAMRGENVTLETAFEHMKTLLALPIQAARVVTGFLIEVAREVLDAVERALSSTLDVPFLSTFYASIVGDGRPFTILNALLLLAAIPSTATYKLFTKKAVFPNGQTYGLDKATAAQLFGAGHAENDDLRKGIAIYEALSGFLGTWARMLSRLIGAVQTLTMAQAPILGKIALIVLAVIALLGAPLSTPIDWDIANVTAWGGWVLDIAAVLVALILGNAPKALSAVIDTIGVIAGFAVGFVGAIARSIKSGAVPSAVQILLAIDVMTGAVADGAIVAMVSKTPQVLAIAAPAMGIATSLSNTLGTVVAILGVAGVE